MSCWDVLGIEATGNVRAIKRAYARSIAQYHPEDDPEGFQVVQEAYEHALAYAQGDAHGTAMPDVSTATVVSAQAGAPVAPVERAASVMPTASAAPERSEAPVGNDLSLEDLTSDDFGDTGVAGRLLEEREDDVSQLMGNMFADATDEPVHDMPQGFGGVPADASPDPSGQGSVDWSMTFLAQEDRGVFTSAAEAARGEGAPDYIKRQFRETQVLRARAATWIGWLGARIEEGDVTPFMRKEPCAEFFALSGFDATLAEMLAPVVRGMDPEALLELEQAVNAPGDARETRALFDRVRAEIKHAHDQKLAPFKKAAIAIVALIYIVVRVWARSTY